jgi:hypothetical protein
MVDTRLCRIKRMCALKSRHAHHTHTLMPLPMHIHPLTSARHKANSMQHQAQRNVKQARSNHAHACTSTCTLTRAGMMNTRPCDTKRMCALKSKHAQNTCKRMPLPIHIHLHASATHTAMQYQAPARNVKQAHATTTHAQALPSTHTRMRA